MSIRLVLFASLLLLGMAPAAMAQGGFPFFPSPSASEPADSDTGCVPMCPGDYSPCDPYYWKQAEGRCQVEHRGGSHHNR